MEKSVDKFKMRELFPQLLCITLYATVIYLTGGCFASAVAASHPLLRDGTPFCGVSDYQPRWRPDSKGLDNRNYAQQLDIGTPRTVRLIYFLPNDRPYQAEVVRRMKDEIRTVQTFFAEQLGVQGYGRKTFDIETDTKGEPIVHRVDGRRGDSYYVDDTDAIAEIERVFDLYENVYLIVFDSDLLFGGGYVGRGALWSKHGGYGIVVSDYSDWGLVAHELGHAFGLAHDFRDGAYIMSYGPGLQDRLSSCSAGYVSVHPYFDHASPLEHEDSPTIELLSPENYPKGSTHVPIRVRVSDSDRIQQVILHAAQPDNRWSVKACRGVSGRTGEIEFDYDGVIPSAHDPAYSRGTSLLDPIVHPIVIEAVDTDGNWYGLQSELFLDSSLDPIAVVADTNPTYSSGEVIPTLPTGSYFPNVLAGGSFQSSGGQITVTFRDSGLMVVDGITYTCVASGGCRIDGRTVTQGIIQVDGTDQPPIDDENIPDIDVEIPDPNLRAAIAAALGKASGAPITTADMENLTRLDAPNANISNLTGLEAATNLRELDLSSEYVAAEGGRINSNSVSDLSPLSGLTSLRRLSLRSNTITDISPVAGLTNLTSLVLDGNSITNISALAGLTNLTLLYLGGNTITDISALAGLTNLEWLDLGGNSISDISGLAGLTKLRTLDLYFNSISDISPVVNLTKLGYLSFQGNSVSNISSLAGLTNLRTLYLLENSITDISPLVANTGLGSGDTVNVSENPLNYTSINTHIPALQNRGVDVQFDAPETVTIPDANLRAAIESTLGKASGAPITTADMANLTELTAPNANISNLTGLEAATNLRELDLGDKGDLVNSNSVSDLSPLTGLTNLNWLFLGVNRISDISALAGLTNLTRLNLRSNNISDISPLIGLTKLTYLSLGGTGSRRISDISAVAGLTKLTYLNVNVSRISDISALAGLTNLTSLSLTYSRISDISAVTGLTNLTSLDLSGNRISDISAVAGLTNLAYLYLGNNISDISPVAGLTNLVGLDLRHNNISDISAVAGLTKLWWLVLNNNSITDISALVANTGLGSGDTVNVKDNPLNAVSINTHIPTLQGRGVAVEFDPPQLVNIPDPNLRAKIESALGKASGAPISTAEMATLTRLDARNANITDLTGLEAATDLTTLYLFNNNISNISPLAGLTNLTGLDLRDTSISNISPLAGLTNLTWLWLGGNTITDISPLVANTGLGSGDTVNVRDNPLNAVSLNTHIPTLQGRGVNVQFDAPAPAQTVDIPDPNLRAAIESALGKASGATITTADMENLTELTAPNANISNLTGLEAATNLTSLDLGREYVAAEGYINSNTISDISAVAGLTNLTDLNLGRNTNISDISAVAGLTNLTDLNLGGNSIRDISALAGLTNLTDLNLTSNPITDISAVSGLTNLTRLYLGYNNITDISAVSGLTNLTRLYLHNNSISDISAVAGLTNLIDLTLANNSIMDISAVSGLTNLTRLHLRSNPITDISAVAGLTNLTSLTLANNSIMNISPVSGLTNLTWLDLGGNRITDLSPVAGLTNLTWLDLHSNTITDISALVANTGLGSGDEVNIRGNPLNYASINTHIPVLQRRGVEVSFDAVAESAVDIPDPNLRAVIEDALGKASGAPITTADMATLTLLGATNANISNLTGLEHAINLTHLYLGSEYVAAEGRFINSNTISDISALAGLTNLTNLNLGYNSISDISALAGLTNLTYLVLWKNTIRDISALAGLTNLTTLYLRSNSITDISAVAGLTNLTNLALDYNTIRDISSVAGLTNLTTLHLRSNSITDISAVAGLTNLTDLLLGGNSITDLSALAGLTNLTRLDLDRNNISDLSALAGLTNLTWLYLRDNSIRDISPVAGLTNLTELWLTDNSITDISPLVANTGLGTGDRVNVGRNPLNYASINTHIPALQSRGVEVDFSDLKPPTLEYLWSIPAGISLIHVPLKVTAVDGVAKTIESISDLYDALGGAATVDSLATYDSQAQAWRSYFVLSVKGSPEDVRLTDATGISANLSAPVSIRLSGDPLGTNGTSTITLNRGQNLVGLPLKDSRINRVSDLLRLDGIWGNVPAVTLTDGGEFKEVGRVGDDGDIAITGGGAFLLTAQRAATVNISGDGWYNGSETAAAPLMAQTGIQVTDTTPMLALRGSIVDEDMNFNRMGFRVIVKNLSTGKAVAAITKDGPASRTTQGGSMVALNPDPIGRVGYQVTIVDVETERAAKIGDTLEISVRSPSPLIGVQPLQYTVTAEDVKRGWIQLPGLVAYEIPAETELLHNYPNPFNPETWIPYRLAEDAFVTLTIYDLSGHVVRTLDVGHRIAAVYESRSNAIYWDGRNEFGETVASGVYFYHLSTGRSGLSVPHRSDYSATRKMLIIK